MTEVAARDYAPRGAGSYQGSGVFLSIYFIFDVMGNANDTSAAHQEFGKRWCGWIACVGGIFVDAGYV